MKSKSPLRPLLGSFPAVSLALGISATFASADTLYWDGNAAGATGNPPTAGIGGTGNWAPGADASPNWWNGSTYQLWSDAGGQDIAEFRGAAGTVTLDGNVSATQLIFVPMSNKFTLTGFSIDLGSTGVIDFRTSQINHTINSALTGSITINATGNTGTLASVAVATIGGTNTGLTSTVVNLATANNFLTVADNVAALGSAGATVKVTQGIVSLAGSAGTTNYNAWNIELNGGTIRTQLNSTLSGPVTLTANSRLMSGYAAGGKLTLTSGATVNLGANTLSISPNSAGGIALDGIISGSGGITQDNGPSTFGTAITTLSAINTYTGATTISKGTFRAVAAASGQAFGDKSAVTTGDEVTAFLDLNGFSQTIGSLAGGGTTGGNVTLGANATLTTGGNGTSTSYAGIISGTGTSGLTKTGIGTQTLTNTNTYTGATTVQQGTLALGSAGTISSALVLGVSGGTVGTLDVTAKALFSQASVSGSGTLNIGTGKTINVTTALAPGFSPGTLNVTGSLALAGTTTTTMEIANDLGTLGVSSDYVNVSETLTLDGVLNIVSFGGYNLAQVGTYNLFDATNGITGAFADVNVGALTDLTHSGTTWSTTDGGYTYSFSETSGVLTVIPEPRAALLGGIGMLLLLRRRRACTISGS